MALQAEARPAQHEEEENEGREAQAKNLTWIGATRKKT